MQANSGTQFDPAVVDALTQITEGEADQRQS
jgi:HD-GYP domain-containing protein (c-di-GMP phosphodiesterase class II)